MESFGVIEQQEFKTKLSEKIGGVIAADIELTVDAGSLVVSARIPTPSSVEADAVMHTLSSELFISALSASLGYLVESSSSPYAQPVASPAPSPPPVTLLLLPKEPPLSPSLEGTDPLVPGVGAGGGGGAAIGIAVGLTVAAVLCVTAGLLVWRRRRRAGGKKWPTSIQDPTAGVSFPPQQTSSTLLPESVDQLLLTTRVTRLRPMLRPAQQWIMHSPGLLRATATDSEMRITTGRLYIEQTDAPDMADSRATLEQWPLATLTSVRRRRHELRHTTLELTMSALHSGGVQSSVVLEFHSREEREKVVRTLIGQKPHLCPPDDQLPEMMEKWHTGEIDNYTYLLHLNDCASRSFDDLSQYPIM